jgi:UDP-N-acetylmuramyl pentapeptide synthase
MPITVLLADLPHLLEDVVGNVFEGVADIRLVRNPDSGQDIAAAALEAGADAVVVAREDPESTADIDRRMVGLASLTVLALTPTGDRAWVHRFRCDATPLGELSAISVLAAVRAAVAS